MPEPSPVPAEAMLKHLEGKSFEDILAWLERALRGQELLPLVVPDEPPWAPVVRHERQLDNRVRGDLREACKTLLRRFVRTTQESDDYLSALLRLAHGLGLQELSADLYTLAANDAAFSPLPPAQQRLVLYALLDLKAPVGDPVWLHVAATYPHLGVIAISGLLHHQGFPAAMPAVADLPDDKAMADSLFIILHQHASKLDPVDVKEMAKAVREVARQCKPQIQEALRDWLEEHGGAAEMAATSDAPRDIRKLKAGLAAFFRRSDREVDFAPRPARLLSTAAA